VSDIGNIKNLNINQWYNLIYIVNFHENEVKAYVDGVLEGSGNPAHTESSLRPLVIGGNIEWDGYISGNAFIGGIADFKFYDHALSEKEVIELSQAKILHYSFNNFEEYTENLVSAGSRYIDSEYSYSGTGYGL